MDRPASIISTLDESRSYPRTHLFVAASLCSDNGTDAVRIRNLSPSGALIEGVAIPPRFTDVVLKRGDLLVAGKIAWQVGEKGGIEFSEAVHVSQWMSGPSNSQQGRIDVIVANFKSGKDLVDPGPAGTAPVDPPLLDQLLELRAELIQLGNSLGGDAALVRTHPEIQNLDILAQWVDGLLNRLLER